MAESTVWQSISGTQSWQIYPLERKPDFQSSNSFIIQSETCFLVVDPGADEAQIEIIVNLINPIASAAKLPVLILATHCHIDHIKLIQSLMDRLDTPGFLFLQEQGAMAIEGGDENLTLTFLFNQPWTLPFVSGCLLTESDRVCLGVREIALEKCLPIQLRSELRTIASGGTIFCQSMKIGENDPIAIYHTPGHSPDSVCIQVGRTLLTGDLFMAANPGVAGVVGWSQDDLIHSLEFVSEWLRQNQVDICYGGHGKSLPAAKAGEIAQKNLQLARNLSGVVVLDKDRVRFLTQYSHDLLDEISELFSIVSGRLLSVAYHLEQLSEAEEARAILGKMDMESIDRFLSEFNQFVMNPKNESRIEMELSIKALTIVHKIKSCFENHQLQGMMDESLLRRIRWLILDFIHVMKGFREEIFGQGENIKTLLLAYLTELRQSVVQDRDFFDSVGDETAFVRELARRIALRNLFESVQFRYTTDIAVSPAYIEKERFCDMTTSLLEPMVAAGANEIDFALSEEKNRILLRIVPRPQLNYARFVERKVQFADRIFQMFGGSARWQSNENGGFLTIALQPAEDYFVAR